MIEKNTFKNSDGSSDWASYHKAQQDIGEICYKCSAFMWPFMWPIRGHPEECKDCRYLSVTRRDAYHSDFIRCPFCGLTQRPDGDGYCDYHSEGLHTVCCKHCERHYEFSTIIERSYHSPARSIEVDDQKDSEKN